MKSFRLISLIAVLAITPASVFAQPDSPSARAAEYQRGRKAMLAKDWKTARDIFAQLWAQKQTYDVALNLGQSELRLNRYRDAAEHLATGIAGIPPHESLEVLERAQNGLRVAKEHVLTLVVTVDESGADLYLDGEHIGKTPLDKELYVEPGPHTIRATHANYEPDQVAVDGKAGEQIPLTLSLRSRPLAVVQVPAPATAAGETTSSAAPANAAHTPRTVAPRTEESAGSARTTVLIVGGAITGVALGTAALFALKAAAHEEDAERARRNLVDEFGQGPCTRRPEGAVHACNELADSLDGRDQANVFVNVSFVVAGVAAAATGAAFFLMQEDAPRESRVRLSFTGQRRAGTVFVTGNF